MANELLCTPPEAYCREFNEDIMSTLREVVNIFGGQYVNAISEYIGETILVDTPKLNWALHYRSPNQLWEDIIGKNRFRSSIRHLSPERTGWVD